MRKFLSILALALCFVACQNDLRFDASNGDLVPAILNITAPELSATRLDGDQNNGTNSAFGAIDFADADADFWNTYDLRYIFEVRTADEDVLVHKETQTFDKYQGTTLEFRAAPNRSYNIYAYADFVLQGSDADLHYNTADLANITVDGMNAMDEAYDAYFAAENFYLTTIFNEDMTLKRFLSKVRVIATDLEWVDGYADPKNVEVTFYNHQTFKSFNIYTGKIDTEVAEPTISYEIKEGYYTEGYDADADKMTLFTTYLYAQDEQTAINFRMDTFDTVGRLIKSNDFSTEIPIQRNYLTTIIGDVLTTSANIQIVIDDNFIDEYIENVEDGEYDNDPVISEGLATFAYNNGSRLAFGDNEGNEFIINIPDAMLVNNALVAGEYEYGDFTISNMKFVAPTTRAAEAVDAEAVGGTMVIKDGANAGEFEFTLDLIVNVVKEGTTEAYYPIFSFKGAITKTALATPELKVTGIANGADYVVTILWDAIAGAKNYKHSSENGGGSTTETSVTYTIKDFEYNTPYTFTVAAQPVNTTLYDASEKATCVVEIKKLAAVENVNIEVAEGMVNVTWDAVDNATGYTVTYGENASANTDKCEYSFEAPTVDGEYEVSVLPTAEGYVAPEATVATYEIKTIVVEPVALATPVLSYELNVNVVTLTWEAIEGAAYYTVQVDDDVVEEVNDTTYEFTGDYEVEYMFTVKAIAADTTVNKDSEAAIVTVTTEAEPVVEATKVTVAEFLAAEEDDTMYELTGVITNVANTTYGNFNLTDATGTVYIYGLCSPEGEQKYWAESGAKLGDTITIHTIRTSFNNAPQGKNAIFVELVPFVETASEWGVVGDLTNWGEDGSADIVMYNTWKADNLFVAYNVEIASGAFKIRANNKWNDDTKNYGLDVAGNIYADKYYSVHTSGGSQNITPMVYGTYDVYFDLANKRVALVTPGKEYADATNGGDPVVIIEGLKDHEWGLVGSFNGWVVANYVVTTVEGDWAVVKNVKLEKNAEFKFAADKAWTLSYGAGCDVNVGETYTTYNNGGNMKFVGETGAYNFYFSLIDAKFYMEAYSEVEEVTATITFDTNDKRTSKTDEQAVWEENGITVTNDKAKSQTNIADYVKPARFYQNSNITVAVDGEITSIVFDCNSNEYAKQLANTIGVEATNDKVNVTLETPASSYVVENLIKQVRMDAITVTYNK